MPKEIFSLPALLLVGLLAAGSVSAAPLKIVGFDDMSCPAWVKSKDDAEQRARYIAWLRGFLSGHNYASQSQQVSAISSGTVELYVNRYCSENPRGEFSTAALRLSDQFSGRNVPIGK